ncbi:MAG: thioredoxin family protein [Arcobacteraceae bacterium]|jgi:hypothetical protein|nr:thioredoxin family protein [Arcobacteraceae bacterium]
MKRKNILLVFAFIVGLFVNLNATSSEFTTSMKYETNYNEAIKKAIKEKKPVMLVLSSTTCPWCRKMENQTLKRDDIDTIVHKNFIPLALDKDTDTYPKEFFPQYIPTVLFINPITGEYFDQSIGYKPYKKFQESLDEAIKDSKRFEK